MFIMILLAAVLLSGCGDEGPSYPSPEGMPDSWVTGSISLGDHSISVSNCEVVKNPSSLPIYEE